MAQYPHTKQVILVTPDSPEWLNETRQIKEMFRSPEARADMEAMAALTEKTRTPLAEAIRQAFKPVNHTIHIEAE